MGYEIFTEKNTRTTKPFVSFSPRGRVGLNQAATAIMEKNAVEFVLVLWDTKLHRVAIRPITKKDNRAYRLARAKSSSMFSAKAFLEFIKYDLIETRSFPAEWNEDEGLLEVEIPVEYLKDSQPKAKLSAVGK
jgi:hypothetical protein